MALQEQDLLPRIPTLPDHLTTVLPGVRCDRLRILVVEDHPLYCDALRALVEREGQFEVVSQASTSADALTLARHYQPHIILLDIGLPGANGLDLVSPLYRNCPDTRIAVVTGCPEHEHLMRAIRLGVYAFLQKDMPGSAILAALEALMRGERVIGHPETLSTILADYGQLLREQERERYGLTEQEISILQLAAAGLNNKEIGARQFWSEITIKRKMQDIYRKMEVKSRAQAVAEAIRLGII